MRGSGILMHISSLPGSTGIGTLGKEAFEFIDFLKAAGQKYWQVLPVCPAGYGNSPYQSYSTFAGNPYFIDLDLLCEDGLLEKSEYESINWGGSPDMVDFDMQEKKIPLLRKAFERFKTQELSDFHRFEEENEIWISNYAMYMTAKVLNNGAPWFEWEENLRKRDPHSLWLFKTQNNDEVFFQMFVQYEFYKQWSAVKEYANRNGIKIIGDIPIYVAADSADVWVSPDLFDLDENLSMINTAGCPPDAFSPTGQKWGNPLYNWQRHRETNYGWWIGRMRISLRLYDIVRIDHFRGFESYFSIPAADETAENGHWEKGPGLELFAALQNALGTLPVIAEDLGALTPEVIEMLQNSGFPGMKVMEFAFSTDFESCYLPHNHIKNCVVYPGTHDNNTIKGWSEEIGEGELDFCKKYLNIKASDDFVKCFIAACHRSTADTVIIQMQDYLGLGSKARMNTPSTVSAANWSWRVRKKQLTQKLAAEIKEITQLYFR